ncbi:MAG: hypothetical protein NC548_53705 [Lachnospiraceae bacterium]|nr:hypothetical protein [Lachnospiraceae bacterium]
MSEITKKINRFFKTAVKSGVVFTDRQRKIYTMFYLKRQDINFIADTLCVCPMVIGKELKIIRQKIARVVDL